MGFIQRRSGVRPPVVCHAPCCFELPLLVCSFWDSKLKGVASSKGCHISKHQAIYGSLCELFILNQANVYDLFLASTCKHNHYQTKQTHCLGCGNACL